MGLFLCFIFIRTSINGNGAVQETPETSSETGESERVPMLMVTCPDPGSFVGLPAIHGKFRQNLLLFEMLYCSSPVT